MCPATEGELTGLRALMRMLLILPGAVGHVAATAQPVSPELKPLAAPRVLVVTASPFMYEPIVPAHSKSAAGVFNSQMMFLAEQLDRNLLAAHRGRKTVITSIVNVNELGQTTSLGRTISEHLMHELAVRLWSIVDVRANVGLILNESGEFLLTREGTRSQANHSDSMVVTGSYNLTSEGLLVNLKVLDAVSAQVLSTAQTRLEPSVLISRLSVLPLAVKSVKISK
jgi:TolB-like protein